MQIREQSQRQQAHSVASIETWIDRRCAGYFVERNITVQMNFKVVKCTKEGNFKLEG